MAIKHWKKVMVFSVLQLLIFLVVFFGIKFLQIKYFDGTWIPIEQIVIYGVIIFIIELTINKSITEKEDQKMPPSVRKALLYSYIGFILLMTMFIAVYKLFV